MGDPYIDQITSILFAKSQSTAPYYIFPLKKILQLPFSLSSFFAPLAVSLSVWELTSNPVLLVLSFITTHLIRPPCLTCKREFN